MLRSALRTATRTSGAGVARFSTQAANQRPQYTEAEAKELIASAQTKKSYNAQAADDLFAATKKANVDLNTPYKSLQQFQKLQASIPSFQSVLDHPLATLERREKLVTSFLEHLGADKASTALLLKINADQKWGALGDIMKMYYKQVTTTNKESVATITSAEPLSADQLAKVSASLNKVITKGNKLVIVEKVNPAILGGLVIDVENMHQDLSLRTAVADIETRLTQMIA